MLPETYERVSSRLPEAFTMNYFADRQSPWLLAHAMPDRARVAELRRGPMAKLLDRPALRTLVARSGGVLTRRDVRGVACADDLDRIHTLGPAGEAAVDAVWAEPWLDFQVSFARWAPRVTEWQHYQVSRPGQNLVIQLNFPRDHAKLLRGFGLGQERAAFEDNRHPIRTSGRPTLAWARVDFDAERGEALIEEVQCDWLRFAQEEAEDRRKHWPTYRSTEVYSEYARHVTARYGKIWQQAVMFAALSVLRDRLGFKVIWMHQPEPGAILKGITEELPPRSIYRQLPKAFCFAETRDAPQFLGARTGCRRTKLQNARMRQVRHLSRLGRSIFWRLDL